MVDPVVQADTQRHPAAGALTRTDVSVLVEGDGYRVTGCGHGGLVAVQCAEGKE